MGQCVYKRWWKECVDSERITEEREERHVKDGYGRKSGRVTHSSPRRKRRSRRVKASKKRF